MDSDDRQVGRIVSRRDVLTLLGATGAALLVGCGTTPETATPLSAASAAAASSGTASSSASAAATSVVTPSTAASAAASTAATAETSADASAEASPAAASATGDSATPAIVAAANAFLATLSETEQETVLFDWTDTAQKQRWSNFPEGRSTAPA